MDFSNDLLNLSDEEIEILINDYNAIISSSFSYDEASGQLGITRLSQQIYDYFGWTAKTYTIGYIPEDQTDITGDFPHNGANLDNINIHLANISTAASQRITNQNIDIMLGLKIQTGDQTVNFARSFIASPTQLNQSGTPLIQNLSITGDVVHINFNLWSVKESLLSSIVESVKSAPFQAGLRILKAGEPTLGLLSSIIEAALNAVNNSKKNIKLFNYDLNLHYSDRAPFLWGLNKGVYIILQYENYLQNWDWSGWRYEQGNILNENDEPLLNNWVAFVVSSTSDNQ